MKRIDANARRDDMPALAAKTAVVGAFAYEAYFFLVAGKAGAGLAGGLAWAGFCVAIFAAIALGGKLGPARRAFFFAAALCFIPSFIAHLIEARGHMAVTAAEVSASQVPFCHIAITTTLLPAIILRTLDFPAQLSGARAAFYPMLAYWLLSLLTLGRGWCSWVCFYGGLEDGLSALPRRARVDISGAGPGLRRINKAVLAFVALASLGSLVPVYCDWLCPFKLITEYSEPSGARSYLALIVFIGLFLALVVALPLLTKKRTQCAALCPFGAMQSLLDRISPFRVAVDVSACVSCGACEKACPMLALNPSSRAKGRAESSCVKCGNCFSSCPRRAIGYSLRGKFRASRGESRPAARAFLEAFVSPALVFPFTALSFGMIISSGFSAETLSRLANLVATGSFLLGAGR